ncbi:MAG: hypothetical protein LBC76_09125 [Treponema sp.]|jgi:hypothetical protein|nr:hypothetical protein [Treponema sp.]
MERIYISNVEGKQAICFDTGLDPRSFARTKMSQSLIECGYIVHPDGSHEVWKSSGVNEINGSMVVWGTPFFGDRLDLLLSNLDFSGSESLQTAALQGVIHWLRAKMFLGDTYSSLNPGATFVIREDGKDPRYQGGSVFFAPPGLSSRCLLVEKTESQTKQSGGYDSAKRRKKSENYEREVPSENVPVLDRYSCPDLTGMEATAFCAGAMLYKILTKSYPYPSDATIFQDMREGIFLPPHLAAISLNKNLCGIINSSLLLPVEKKRTGESGTEISSNLLHALMDNESKIVPVSSLFVNLSVEESILLEKEKRRYFLIKNTYAKTKRFVVHNKHVIIGALIGVLFLLFIFVSTTKSLNNRPTTEGMASDAVIVAYYDAFSSLNHTFMEACIQGADKTDINTAVSFYALSKTRQAYEMSNRYSFIPAKAWKEAGGELPAPDVFGVTDLSIEYMAGGEEADMIIYRANYLLWSPEEYSISRSDIITLKRDKKKNWRIAEIIRTEK